MLAVVSVLTLTLIVGALLWRWACLRVNIPWPSWLAFWLENPFMKLFCHPRAIVKLLDPRDGQSVLDIGCGAGRIAIPLAQALPSISVLGIDLQGGMLRRLEAGVSRWGLTNLSFQQLDLSKKPLPQGTFERIVIVTVLGEIPGYQQVLEQAYQRLTPGGILSVTEVIPDPCYIPSSRLRRECEAIGFKFQACDHNLFRYTMNLTK